MSQDERPSVDIQPAIPPGISLHLEAGNRRIRELGIDEELVRRTVDRAAAQLARKPSRLARLAVTLGRPLTWGLIGAAAGIAGIHLSGVGGSPPPDTQFTIQAIPLVEGTPSNALAAGSGWQHGEARVLWRLSRAKERELRAAVANCSKHDGVCIVTSQQGLALTNATLCAPDGPCHVSVPTAETTLDNDKAAPSAKSP